ncbi:hypothetical protein [Mycoplasma sp. Mirounga ES2805-ORL]|uniref:hypothetical protein n=1 Tax=Mycoplasma sp. Mirounga ES2805-ORL TaxID=754514 RepID=UPI00197B1FC3|nr:hypothetical protein [Mycoplasma sp. Mirounga ES2805-ORL]QSF13424.1 hypothetical protein JXZ90_01975 [Mycoplasma sp. Mirounga ES2805-ORL]
MPSKPQKIMAISLSVVSVASIAPTAYILFESKKEDFVFLKRAEKLVENISTNVLDELQNTINKCKNEELKKIKDSDIKKVYTQRLEKVVLKYNKFVYEIKEAEFKNFYETINSEHKNDDIYKSILKNLKDKLDIAQTQASTKTIGGYESGYKTLSESLADATKAIVEIEEFLNEKTKYELKVKEAKDYINEIKTVYDEDFVKSISNFINKSITENNAKTSTNPTVILFKEATKSLNDNLLKGKSLLQSKLELENLLKTRNDVLNEYSDPSFNNIKNKLDQEFEKAQTNQNSLEHDPNFFKKTLAELQKSINEAKVEKEKLIKEHQTKLDELEIEIAKAHNFSNDLKSKKYNDLKTILDLKIEEITKIANNVNSLTPNLIEAINDLRKTVNIITNNKKELDNQIRDAHNKLKTIINKKDEKLKEYNEPGNESIKEDLSKAFDKAEQVEKNIESTLDELKSATTELEIAIENAKDNKNLNNIDNAKKFYEETLKNITNKISELDSSQNKTDYLKIIEKLKTVKTEAVYKVNNNGIPATIDIYKEAVKSIKAALKISEDEKNAIDEVITKRTEYESELSKLNDLINELTSENSNLYKSIIDKLSEQKNTITNEINTTSDKTKVLYETAKSNILSYINKAKKLKDAKDELQVLLDYKDVTISKVEKDKYKDIKEWIQKEFEEAQNIQNNPNSTEKELLDAGKWLEIYISQVTTKIDDADSELLSKHNELKLLLDRQEELDNLLKPSIYASIKTKLDQEFDKVKNINKNPDATLDTLSDAISTLQQEIDKAKSDKENLDNKIEEAKDKYEHEVKNIDAKISELNSLDHDADYQKLLEKLTSAKLEADTTARNSGIPSEESYKEAILKITGALATYDEEKNNIDELIETRENYNSELSKLNGLINNLNTTNSELYKPIIDKLNEQKEAITNALASTSDKTKSNYETAISNIQNSLKEADEWKSAKDKLEEVLKTKENILSKVAKDKYSDIKTWITKKFDKAQEVQNNKDSDKDKITSATEVLEKSIQELNNKTQEQNAKLQAKHEELNTLINTKDEIDSLLDSNAYSVIKTKVNKAFEQAININKNPDATLDTLSDAISTLQQAIDKAKSDKENLDNKIEEAKGKYEIEVKNIEAKISELNSSPNNNDYQTLIDKLNKIKNEADNISKNSGDPSEESYKAGTNKIKNVLATYDEEKNNIDELIETRENYNSELSKLNGLINNLNTTNSELYKPIIDKLNEQKEAITNALASTSDKTKSNYETAISNIQNSLKEADEWKSAKDKLEEVLKTKENILSKVAKDKYNDIKTWIAEEFYKAQQAQNNKDSDKDKITSAKEVLEKSIKEVDTKIDEQDAKLQTKHESLDQIIKTKNEIDSLLNSNVYSEIKTEVDKAFAEATNISNDQEVTESSLDSAIEKLQKAIEKAKTSKKDLDNKIDIQKVIYEKSVKDLESKIEELTSSQDKEYYQSLIHKLTNVKQDAETIANNNGNQSEDSYKNAFNKINEALNNFTKDKNELDEIISKKDEYNSKLNNLDNLISQLTSENNELYKPIIDELNKQKSTITNKVNSENPKTKSTFETAINEINDFVDKANLLKNSKDDLNKLLLTKNTILEKVNKDKYSEIKKWIESKFLDAQKVQENELSDKNALDNAKENLKTFISQIDNKIQEQDSKLQNKHNELRDLINQQNEINELLNSPIYSNIKDKVTQAFQEAGNVNSNQEATEPSLDSTIQTLREAINKAKNDKANLDEEIKQSKNKYEQAVKNIESKITTLTQENSEFYKPIIDILNKQKVEITNNVDHTEPKTKDIYDNAVSTIQNVISDAEELKLAKDSLKIEIDKKQDTLNKVSKSKYADIKKFIEEKFDEASVIQNNATSSKDNINDATKKLQEALEETTNKISQRDSDIQSKRHQLKELLNKQTSLDDSLVSPIYNEIKQVLDQAFESAKSIDNDDSTLDTLNETITQLQGAIDHANNDKRALDNKIFEAKTQYEQAIENINAKISELESLGNQSDYSSLINKLNQAKQEAEVAANNNGTPSENSYIQGKNKIEEALSNFDNEKNKIAELINSRNQYDLKVTEINQLISSLKSSNETLYEQIINKLKVQQSSITNDVQSAHDKTKTIYDKAVKDIQDAITEANEIKNAKDLLQEELNKEEETLQKVLKEKYSDIKIFAVGAFSDAKDVQNQNGADKDELISAKETIHNAIEQVQAKIDARDLELKAKHEELLKIIHTQDETLSLFNENAYSSIKEQLKQSFETAKTANNNLDSTLEELNNAITILQNSIRMSKQNKEKKFEEAKQQLKLSINKKSETNSLLQGEKYKDIKETLENAYNHANSIAESSSSSCDQLVNEKTTLEEAIDKAKKDKLSRDNEISSVKNILQDNIDRLKEYKDKDLLNIDSKINTTLSKAEGIYTSSESTKEQVEEISNQITQLIQEAKTYKQAIDDYKIGKSNVENKITELQGKDPVLYKHAIDELNKKISDANSNLSANNHDLNSLNKAIQDFNEALNSTNLEKLIDDSKDKAMDKAVNDIKDMNNSVTNKNNIMDIINFGNAAISNVDAINISNPATFGRNANWYRRKYTPETNANGDKLFIVKNKLVKIALEAEEISKKYSSTTNNDYNETEYNNLKDKVKELQGKIDACLVELEEAEKYWTGDLARKEMRYLAPTKPVHTIDSFKYYICDDGYNSQLLLEHDSIMAMINLIEADTSTYGTVSSEDKEIAAKTSRENIIELFLDVSHENTYDDQDIINQVKSLVDNSHNLYIKLHKQLFGNRWYMAPVFEVGEDNPHKGQSFTSKKGYSISSDRRKKNLKVRFKALTGNEDPHSWWAWN